MTDPSGAVIVTAKITLTNQGTEVSRSAITNGDGVYVIPFLQPGDYRALIEAIGFQTESRSDIRLEIGQHARWDLTLSVGKTEQSLTVTAGPTVLNTSDASVSTVTNRKLLESIPLNGRTINSLLELTPGVVNAPTGLSNAGQFSVNGQRTDANYLSVDGVSANFGTTTTTPAQSGSQFALSALGGTNTLVSTDAIEEFRVYTSSFAPEYGRSPGGQIQISTRSGTNDFHGSLFEYFRNDKLDANDWFANSVGKARPAERHNDFGGVFGGPIVRNRLFFFGSHETLLLRQPQAQAVTVPSETARAQALPITQPLLNLYPIPDAAASNPNATTFTGVWSNTGSLHATSVRADYLMGSKTAWFGRVNFSPSTLVARFSGLNTIQTTPATTSTVTLGAIVTLSPWIAGSMRFNFSQATYASNRAIDSFGGAKPVDIPQITNGLITSTESELFQISVAGLLVSAGRVGKTVIPQLNFLGDMGFHFNRHDLKAGVDWLRLTPDYEPNTYLLSLIAISGPAPVINNKFDVASLSKRTSGEILQQNFSTYLQDTWRISQRLTLTYGLRWDVNPGVEGYGSTALYQFRPTDNLSQATLQKVSRLWSTTLGDFAPRVGVAYRFTDRWPIVVRAGMGLFYDAATGPAGQIFGANPPYTLNAALPGVSLPLTVNFPTTVTPPISATPQFIPDLTTPYSIQWNVALESQITPSTNASATYVGQDGRNLLRTSSLNSTGTQFSSFQLTDNSGFSNYEALQLQLKRRGERLNASANYTWSHSIDISSADVNSTIATTFVPLGLNRGSSDFDVRQSASIGANYSIGLNRTGLLGALVSGWAVSGLIQMHSGFPINIFATSASFAGVSVRPDLVGGIPLWISDPSVARGKRLNSVALQAPKTARQGTLGRNIVYGPGFVQADAGLTRSFNLTERVKLSIRAEAFNILNHPNFTNPVGQVGLPLFGIATTMLNQSLGGLNSVFQSGGPRSVQITARFSF